MQQSGCAPQGDYIRQKHRCLASWTLQTKPEMTIRPLCRNLGKCGLAESQTCCPVLVSRPIRGSYFFEGLPNVPGIRRAFIKRELESTSRLDVVCIQQFETRNQLEARAPFKLRQGL